jgi:hypothetical protein
VIYFDVNKSQRPDGTAVTIHLFYGDGMTLTPAEYTCLKMFFLEANRLWRISSRRVDSDHIDDVG